MPRLLYLGQFDETGRSGLLNVDIDGHEIAFWPNTIDLNNEINTLLPDGLDALVKNPSFIRDLGWVFVQSCKLNITFLKQNADYKNSFGYFIYDLSNPPKTVNDIEDLILIFPNCKEHVSSSVDDGALWQGDTMQLAFKYDVSINSEGLEIATPTDVVFPAGKAISFFMVQDGWYPLDKMVVGGTKFFSLQDLNWEPFWKHHFISITSTLTDGIFVTVEDQTNFSGDRDFNDVVVFATVDPVSAIRYDTYCHQVTKNNPPALGNCTLGYKKVFTNNIDGTISEAVATLRIPNDADVRSNPEEFCPQKKRTNKAYIESIVVVSNTATTSQFYNLSLTPMIGAWVQKAHSHCNLNFEYNDQDWVYSTISDDTTNHNWLEGIHFFSTWDEARLYNPREMLI